MASQSPSHVSQQLDPHGDRNNRLADFETVIPMGTPMSQIEFLNSSHKSPDTASLGFFPIYKRIFSLATVSERCLYAIGILLSLGSGTVLPLMTLIFGNTISIFTDFALGRITGDDLRQEVYQYTLYFIYLFIARAALTYAYMVIFSIVATNVNIALRKLYLHSVLRQGIPFHETILSSGAFSLALSTHSNAIRSGLAEKFGLSLKAVSTIIAAFAVALHSQWRLALVTATVIPAAVIAIGITSAFDEKKEEALNDVKAEAATVAEEVLSSTRTVRALGAEGRLSKKYQKLLNRATDIAWKRSPIVGTQVGSYMFALYGAYALAFWYGIKLYARGEAQSSGIVITALFSIMIGINAFSELAAHLGAFMRIRSAGDSMFNIIDSAPADKPVSDFSKKGDEDIFQQDISLKDVSFQYPSRPGVQALDNFAVMFPAGTTTALVGPSGSGKSTVVGLLLGWYSLSKGSLSFGTRSIDELAIETIRANIGLVQQEPLLFSGTVLQNVEYGLSGGAYNATSADEKKEMVIKACKLSNAHDFILRLPQGYDTQIGNRGTLLSGGQKQRIAIARAIIKDPPILILDEATSALDAFSEAIVQQALENARSNRTTISIAHRLTTIQAADQIVVMRQGSVVEIGTHVSLTAIEDGLYKRLWDAQSLTSTAQSDGTELHNEIRLGHQKSSLQRIATNKVDSTTVAEDSSDVLKSDTGLAKTLAQIFQTQKKYWWAFLLLFSGSAIGGALFPMQAFLYAKVVSTFELTGSALIDRGDFWAFMWFILALVVAVAYFTIGAIGTGLGESVSQDYRFTYFKSIASQRLSFFDKQTNSASALLSRLATEPDNLNSLTGSNLAVLITVLVSLISTVTLALATGWKLALVVIFGGLPFIFGAGVIHERMENSFEERAAKVFETSVGFAGECVAAIKTVSALNMESLVEKQFGDLLSEHGTKAARHEMRAMVWFALSEAIELLCMALAFWYGGRLMSFNEYSTTQFFVVFVAIIFGSQSMGQFFAHSSDMSKGLASARSIISMSANGSENAHRIKALPSLHRLDPTTPLIEFCNTTFAYPSRASLPVLRGFNLKIYRGQFIALVGASGCGKSTIVQLLERFYDVESGDILIGGVSIKDLRAADVRSLFALVSQEPTLYSDSIKYNIALGTNVLPSEKLDRVLQQAQLADFVASLPEGTNTQIGAKGAALSGGQKQRVAIARALAQDAPVLLLDEATSALDSGSERLIQTSLLGEHRYVDPKTRSHSHGEAEDDSNNTADKPALVADTKTVIAVAHRLSTIQHADCIFVLDAGRIIESGVHSKLFGQKGVYWSMCRAQAGLTDI